jgi:hypothetical protein
MPFPDPKDLMYLKTVADGTRASVDAEAVGRSAAAGKMPAATVIAAARAADRFGARHRARSDLLSSATA